MYPASDRVKLTYEDLVALPDDGMRHELIDGEHYVTAAPFLSHQRLAFLLTLRVGGFVETNRLGLFFFAPADVLLSAYDVVQPDMFFISSERAAIAGSKNVQGAPDLVIEGLESSNAYSTLSLDAPDSSDDSALSMIDVIGGDDEGLEHVENRETIKPLLEALDPREKHILTLRFFRGMTQSQIAAEIGISQMHVSRLLARTLERLRDSLEESSVPPS